MKLFILVVLMSFAIGAIGAPNYWMRKASRNTGCLPSCIPGGSSWYHVDNGQCNRYYQCYDGVINHFSCPPGKFVNLDSNGDPEACLLPWQVECGSRHYQPPVASFEFIRLNITVQAPDLADAVYDIVVPKMPLIYAMHLLAQQATDPAFSFVSTSHPFLGEFTNTIIGLTATGNQYWSILNPVELIQVGSSSYIPSDQEHIVFNLSSF